MTLDPGTALPARPSPGAAGARLGELYTDNARMVYGLCRMLLNDPTEAEDATQQVFLSAYRSLLTGTEVEKPSAWLGTIARNECRARSVALGRSPVALDVAVTLVSPGADEQAVGRADAAELYSEVAALPDKQRAAVVLRDIYGLRYDEVAAALGTSRPAVESLLFRGRRRLQRRLRPGLAAGVLVVPLSLHESLAYAVPGFVAAGTPAGAAAGLLAGPLLAKVAAVGAAAALAGSAGVAVERQVDHGPARPADVGAAVTTDRAAAPTTAAPATARSLIGAGTPLLEARVAATAEKRHGGDDARGEHEVEAAKNHEDGAKTDEPEHRSGSDEATEAAHPAKDEALDGPAEVEAPPADSFEADRVDKADEADKADLPDERSHSGSEDQTDKPHDG